MEKFIVLTIIILVGIFIAFLGTMILARMLYDIVMVFIRIYHWLGGKKRSASTSC